MSNAGLVIYVAEIGMRSKEDMSSSCVALMTLGT